MARRTILLSEVNLTEESVNQDVSGNLAVTGTSTFTGVASFGDGTAAAPSITYSADADTGFYRASSGSIGFTGNGTNSFSMASTGISLASAATLNWNADTILARDAADVLAMKNSSTAQTLRIYGDATAATLKYMTLTHDGTNGLITTSGGTFGFGTHTTSAGTNINGVTGYISIVDSGGTPRRLAVLT